MSAAAALALCVGAIVCTAIVMLVMRDIARGEFAHRAELRETRQLRDEIEERLAEAESRLGKLEGRAIARVRA